MSDNPFAKDTSSAGKDLAALYEGFTQMNKQKAAVIHHRKFDFYTCAACGLDFPTLSLIKEHAAMEHKKDDVYLL